MKIKKPKGLKNAHTANTKYGMGDNYGSGIKAKVGKLRDGTGMANITKAKIKTPPKTLA